MIRIGIPGMPGAVNARQAEAAAHKTILDTMGAAVIGDWFGSETIVNGSNQVTSWPGHVGPTMILESNSSGPFSRTFVNGRPGIITPEATTRGMIATGFTMLSVIVVAVSPTLPTAAQYALAHANSTAGAAASLLLTDGSSSWYTTSGWTHYQDGLATEALAAGMHVYQADRADNAVADLVIGRWALDPTYPKEIMRVVAFSAVPDAGQRTTMTSAIMAAYRL